MGWRRKPKATWWRRGKWLLVITLVLLIPTFVIVIQRTWFAEHADQIPQLLAAQPKPEVQIEPHTCAVHAVNTVYRAYGVNPSSENLRYRLGTDFFALVWLRDSTGTFHPDLYMVLDQDGFDYETISPKSSDSAAVVHQHLDQGHLAIFLIQRRENGHLHWVVGSAGDDQRLWIADSLTRKPYLENTQDYFSECVVSAILVKPQAGEHQPSSIFAHFSGAFEMLRFLPRL